MTEQQDQPLPQRTPSGGCGCSLRTLMIAVMLGSIAMGLFTVVCSNFSEAQIRAHVSRSKADLRSLATALESYFADHGSFPPCGVEDPSPRFHADGTPVATSATTVNTGVVGAPLERVTFRHGTLSHQLTTPTAYLTSYYSEAYHTVRGLTPGYYTHGGRWIIWAVGPGYADRVSGNRVALDGRVERVFDPFVNQSTPSLIECAYDTSNGTYSDGDILRHSEMPEAHRARARRSQ